MGTYHSSDTSRISIVHFICDPSVDTPDASVQGEIEPLTYHFSIRSKYACLRAAPVKVNCTQLDQCSCRFDDGSGIVDLTGLGKHGRPLISDVQVEHYFYSFNPCFSFDEGTCHEVAGCQLEKDSGIYIDIGAAFPITLRYDGSNVIGSYTSSDGLRSTIVTYVCNLSVDDPIFIAHGEIYTAKYAFSIVSKEICPKKETVAMSDIGTAVAGAVGPLFWPSMLSTVPLFSTAAVLLTCF